MVMKVFPKHANQEEQDVWLMAQRTALVYMEMAKALVDALGEEQGKQAIKDAIWRVGTRCGQQVREHVLGLGMEPIPDNHGLAPDLPSKGWRTEDGKVTFCPLAAVWIALGEQELGRIYCNIDPSKFNAYNPGLWCTHDKNVLDGDDCCIIRIHSKGEAGLAGS